MALHELYVACGDETYEALLGALANALGESSEEVEKHLEAHLGRLVEALADRPEVIGQMLQRGHAKGRGVPCGGDK